MTAESWNLRRGQYTADKGRRTTCELQTGIVNRPPTLRLEAEHNTGGIAEAVLLSCGVGGETCRQRVGGVEPRANVVDLRRADGKSLGQADINAPAESHLKPARTGHPGRKSANERKP